MLYSRSQSSPILLSFLVSLLAATTQSLPINVSGSLDNVAHINTSATSPLLNGCGSLVKRAVGGIPMSGALAGVTGRPDVVRRAVGTVADSGCGTAAVIQATSNLAKRSNSIRPSLLQPPIAAPSIPDQPIIDNTRVVNALHLLVKRGNSAPRTSQPTKKPQAQSLKKVQAKPMEVQAQRMKKEPAPPIQQATLPAARKSGQPDTEEKWGRSMARSW
ncbi:hypothetical protein PtB15_2B909 [Puccinia triticina]|nr:hypothetical protein PtB15_2B909 [Puccinia triticina]